MSLVALLAALALWGVESAAARVWSAHRPCGVGGTQRFRASNPARGPAVIVALHALLVLVALVLVVVCRGSSHLWQAMLALQIPQLTCFLVTRF
jgi:hypothetical protein